MRNIIFIPFSSREGNLSLFLRALTWRYNLKKDSQTQKAPDIVIYRRPDESVEDYDQYDAAQFKFSPETLTPDTNIYVVADGMGSNHFIANTHSKKNPDSHIMPIELAAQRLKEVGFTPELAKKIKAIKLFICDQEAQNQSLAVNFAKAMGEEYKDLNVFYYTATVTLPTVLINRTNLHSPDNTFPPQGSVNQTKKYSMEFEVSQNNARISKLKGIAHENRVKIKVDECLNSNNEELPEYVTLFLVANQAKSMHSLEFAVTTLESIEEIHDTQAAIDSVEPETYAATKTYTVSEPEEMEVESTSVDSNADDFLPHPGLSICDISDHWEAVATNTGAQSPLDDKCEVSDSLVVRKEWPIIKYNPLNFFPSTDQQNFSLASGSNKQVQKEQPDTYDLRSEQPKI